MLNASSSKREESIALRKQGLSYNEISEKLKVPKSTLSNWLKNLPLSEVAKKRNIDKAKLAAAKNIVELNRARAEKYQVRVRLELSHHADNLPIVGESGLFWLGLGLFLAEGSKREKWSIRFVNSDPTVIRIMMKFFRQRCEVRNESFKFRIHLHPDSNPDESLKFWAKIASISEKQFYRPYFGVSKSSQGKRPVNRLPHGTLHVIIGDTKLVRKLKGWLIGLQKQFEIS